MPSLRAQPPQNTRPSPPNPTNTPDRRNIQRVGQRVSLVRERVQVAAAVTCAVVLVGLMPLLGSSAASTDLVLVSLAVLALDAAVGTASWSVAVMPCGLLFSPAPSDDPPLLIGPATDPMRHPVAPRAPGQA